MDKTLSKLLKSKNVKLNIGSGETKLPGFINIDVEKKTKPDIVWDVTKRVLPFKDGTISQINCIHNLEHIEFSKWANVLGEFNRVLKLNGWLILAYPEFEVCSRYFLENYRGAKDYWRKTLYGRQLYRGDYHVTPMVTKDIIQFLMNIGFDNFKHAPEVGELQECNTFMTCRKVKLVLREDILKKAIFG